jgi:hypothetical protein
VHANLVNWTIPNKISLELVNFFFFLGHSFGVETKISNYPNENVCVRA